MKSYLFSIAGNIAAGKSTLTQALEARSGGKIVSFLERVDYVKENGYLQKYYEAVTAYDRIKGMKLDGKDREGFLAVKREAEYWGYKIQETYFLSRLLDLGVLTELLREGQSVAQDRSIYEDQIFTKNSNNHEYITDADYRKYLDLFELVMKDKPRPDLIIYLESDVAALKQRIIGRSRGEEAELASPDNPYLANLNNLYRPWIMKCGLPYLVIDTEAVDFRTEAGLEKVVEGIVRKVPGRDTCSSSAVLYRLLADFVFIVHFAFVLFVVLGGFAAWRAPRIAWLHVPAVAWAALVSFAGWICPLTPWEQSLRRLAGEAGYAGGFVEHYLLPVLYPEELTRVVQIALGVAVLALNVVAYSLLAVRRRKGAPRG